MMLRSRQEKALVEFGDAINDAAEKASSLRIEARTLLLKAELLHRDIQNVYNREFQAFMKEMREKE